MSAKGHTRITIGADDVQVSTLAKDAGGDAQTCCSAIRVHGAGSIFCLLEGQLPSATPTEHEFYAAGEGLGLRIRTIRGTGGDAATASDALEIDLYWS